MERTTIGKIPFRFFIARLAWLALLLFGLSLTAQAQSTAVLKGTVTDATGAAVPNAKVAVKNQGTGVAWNTQTDEVGSYLVPSLPPGVYEITVSKQEFQSAVVSHLTLDVGTTVTQNIPLKVGNMTQQVVITGEAPVIDTSTISVGQVINQKTVQEIPLNGRHFVDLSLLTPMTVTPPANGFLTFPLRGQGSFAFNTAGQREDTVNFMINGVNLNDMVQNQITFQPSINTVSEFKVDNSTYSAQYGRNSGAIVNIATRSGTNEFHGEIFEWVRNEKLDAKNFFAAKKGPFKRNNFGAAAGGPLKRDRAHFFLSYEGLRQRQGITINGLDLSQNEVNTAKANGDAAIQKLLPLIPPANSVGTGNPNDPTTFNFFRGSASAPVNIDQGTADIDYELTSSDHLHGYVAIQQDLRQEPTLQGNTLPGWGDTRKSRRQIGTVSEDHIFGPNLTNTVRLGYNRIHIVFTPNQLLNSANFNINNGINAPIGLAQIDIGGFAMDFGGPSGFPQGRGDTSAVLSDTVSYLHGRHSWAFGAEMRRFYNNNFSQDTTFFSFPTTTAFINDQATSFRFVGTSANRILSPAWGAFVEDSWKWRPNVTFQLGLRYDWISTPSEAKNRFVVFDPVSVSLVQVGTPGFGQAYHTNNRNFQPRVGVVWDPFNNGKTVIRSGYAILADQPVTNSITGLNSNPPFTTPLTFGGPGPISLVNAINQAGPSGLAPNAINPHFNNPYVQSWNLNLEQQLTQTLGLTVGYIGSKGTHLRIARNFNQRINGGARPFPKLSASSPIDPGATIGNILEVDSVANSTYNGGWISLNKRISHGLQFNTSYTFAKSIDDNSLNSQGIILQDSTNVGNNRGLSDFDVRHRFVISGFYELPFKGNRFVEGWQLGVITQAQSGSPLSVVTSLTSFTGTTGAGALRPDINSQVVVLNQANEWFVNSVCTVNPAFVTSRIKNCSAGPAQFVLPVDASGNFHFGKIARNAITGPAFVNTDFSIVKNTRITERLNVQFRTEFFDMLNQVNFGNPNLTAGSGTFGRITSTRFPTGDFGSSRQVQFALKLQF